MGRPKLALPFGPELMLQRVVRILGEVVQPIVVVASPDQELPPLPAGVRITRDENEYLGPLAGLAIGLTALEKDVSAAYVSSCDVPLLRPEFVRAMIDAFAGFDIAVPRDGQFHHPLAAVYHTGLGQNARRLIEAGKHRPVALFDDCCVHEVRVEQLRAVDPELTSLQNINTPEDYEAALRLAGFADDRGADD